MLFNSYIFILLFLPLAVIGYFVFESKWNHCAAKIFLLMMSLWFYGYFSVPYLLLFAVSLIVNYMFNCFVAKADGNNKKVFFGLGMGFNLGLLFLFKYYDFFAENINHLFRTDWVLLRLMLPLGISFFTFQQLSYLIDIYWQEADLYPFLDFAVYITFFPQLVAGPIVLHDEFIPQLNEKKNRRLCPENMEKGLMAFTIGLAKKVLVADSIGFIVNWSYSNIAGLSGLDVVITMISYTLQIYYDFSGYSDMASGIAWMFNIALPMNFDSPYKADNIVDFWKRWHMTLTRFFSRYVYIPLGGNRKGKIRTYLNILTVFFVSGLWHGANWTFIIWGGCHGIANIFYRAASKYLSKIPGLLRWIGNFVFINLMWMLFRSDSVGQALAMIKQLFRGTFWKLSEEMVSSGGQLGYKIIYKILQFAGNMGKAASAVYVFLLLAGALLVCLRLENVQRRLEHYRMTWIQAFGLAALLLYTVLSLTVQSTFLYFNF